MPETATKLDYETPPVRRPPSQFELPPVPEFRPALSAVASGFLMYWLVTLALVWRHEGGGNGCSFGRRGVQADLWLALLGLGLNFGLLSCYKHVGGFHRVARVALIGVTSAYATLALWVVAQS